MEEHCQKKAVLDEVLDLLHSKHLQFWDLLEYVFNPANGMGSTCHGHVRQRARSKKSASLQEQGLGFSV